MNPAEFIPYKSVTLERLTFGINLTVHREALGMFDDYVAAQVRGYVWSQDAGKKEVVRYPADWWQAFKARWFPAWLLARYPVIHKVYEFQVKATYPDLQIQHHAPVLRLMRAEFTDDRPAV